MSQAAGAQSNVVFAWGNLVDANQTITYSSQNSLAPMSYAANDFRSVVAKFTGCTSEYMRVTFAAGASSFNCFAVVGTNMTTSGTVAFHGSTDGFSSSDVTLVPPTPLLVNSVSGAIVSASLFICDASTTYSSIKVIFADSTNTAGYIQFARLFVGTAWQPTYNWDYGITEGTKHDHSKVYVTQNQVSHFNAKPQQAIPRVPFKKMLRTDKQTLDGMYDVVGITTPFFVQLDPDYQPELTYWCSLRQRPEPVLSSFRAYDFTMDLEEWI